MHHPTTLPPIAKSRRFNVFCMVTIVSIRAQLHNKDFSQARSHHILRREERAGLETAASVASLVETRLHLQETPAVDIDTCNLHYVSGQRGTTDCPVNATDSLLLNKMRCRKAATEQGIALNNDTFEIAGKRRHQFPPGCFVASCSEDDTDDCYFFNGESDLVPECFEDSSCAGSPICTRDKFKAGTVSSTNVGKCPDDYYVIEDESSCFDAAACLGVIRNEKEAMVQVIISDPTSFPKGCFILDQASPGQRCCSYYNPPETAGTPDPAKASQFVATPVCSVVPRPLHDLVD